MAITHVPNTYKGTINISSSPNATISVGTISSGSIYSSASQVYTVGAGGGGSSSYLTAGASWNTVNTNTNIKISGNNPTLSTDTNVINLNELSELLNMFKEVMMFSFEDPKVLAENPTLHDAYTQYKDKLKEKYNDPELKEVYNQYKLIKALSQKEEKE
jgi:hypothetical protein